MPHQEDRSVRYTFIGSHPQSNRFGIFGSVYNWIFGQKLAPPTQYPDQAEDENIKLIVEWYQWFHDGKTPPQEFIDRVLVNLRNVSMIDEEQALPLKIRVRNEVVLTYIADEILKLEEKKRRYRRLQTLTGVIFLVGIFTEGTVATTVSETVFRNDDGTRATIGTIVNGLSILLPVFSGSATFSWEFPIARLNVNIIRLLNHAKGYGSETREFFTSREEKYSQYTGPTFNLFLSYLRQAGHGPQVTLRSPEEGITHEDVASVVSTTVTRSRSNSLVSSVQNDGSS